MEDSRNRVCPVEAAGGLDNAIRRWLQQPRKILSPYVREGTTALDFGCGPGFFTLALAQLVGPSGRVIACDLQQGMLEKLGSKLEGTEFESRIRLHQCGPDALGLTEKVDFILAFYVMHEVPDQARLLAEFAAAAAPGAQVLVVEPPFHVSTRAFRETLRQAQASGFGLQPGPRVFLSRTAVLRKD